MDDAVLLALSTQNIQLLLHKINVVSEQVWLEINRTKFMVVARKCTIDSRLVLGEKQLGHVE